MTSTDKFCILPNDKLHTTDTLRQRLVEILDATTNSEPTKQSIRELHVPQRRERSQAESVLLSKRGQRLLAYFAEGHEINPNQINPKLVLVNNPNSLEGYLFRVATLLWSVPVSKGYGRRMRYLVVDKQNSKIIGLLALGDPVFNLKCRDQWIGWDAKQRCDNLTNMLDAYVLGAVPPYSTLLGGKLIGSLLTSKEIQRDFRGRYASKKGLISQRTKNPRLVLITTTSALGRSSIYNRLRLPGVVDFIRIGKTIGWGHFRVSDDLFKELRSVLTQYNDSYANGYKFGQGPNWKIRVIRKACSILGVNSDLLFHGIQREVYAVPISGNYREVLLGHKRRPTYKKPLLSVSAIGKLAVRRWVIPRSERNDTWKKWTRNDTWNALAEYALSDQEAHCL